MKSVIPAQRGMKTWHIIVVRALMSEKFPANHDSSTFRIDKSPSDKNRPEAGQFVYGVIRKPIKVSHYFKDSFSLSCSSTSGGSTLPATIQATPNANSATVSVQYVIFDAAVSAGLVSCEMPAINKHETITDPQNKYILARRPFFPAIPFVFSRKGPKQKYANIANTVTAAP